jgi:hypothetical protein
MQSQLAGPRWAAFTALSLAVAALSLAVPAYADGLEAKGTVSEVQLPAAAGGTGSLTLATRLGPVPFAVNADTQIEVDDRAGALTDVQVGYTAEVEYLVTTGGFVATKLDVERPHNEIFGLVADATRDPATNVVTVKIVPPVGDPMTLKIDGTTRVELGKDEDADLASATLDVATLKGSYAKAEYPVGSDVATEIAFRPARRLPFKGVVQSASATSLTVGWGEQSLSLAVVPGTICRLNGKTVDPSALTPGDRCEGTFWMVLNGDGSVANVALVVKAQTPRPVEFSGTIAPAPAPAPGPATTAAEGTGSLGGPDTLYLTLRNGTTVPILVSSSTRIKINGKPGTFADLQPGQKCHVLCTPRPDGKNADGTDKTRYDCFRLQAQKLRPAGESRR